ncbi:hypothetical protein OUZ56_005497 [Daphnia magna]|uniref:Uncharacterized protein n=1 Tax=Daphnia magna TaxID=35525 RepID=A0ABQ9YSY6_9CRUS|nr:hypothetical protein OUZ56_005497 [Daphnia magna]
MLEAVKKRFATFEENTLFKLASTLDPRWKATFGFKFEEDFIRGVDTFEKSIGRASAVSEVPPTSETPSSTPASQHQSGSKWPASQLSILMSKMRKRNPPLEDIGMLRMEVSSYLAIPDVAEHQTSGLSPSTCTMAQNPAESASSVKTKLKESREKEEECLKNLKENQFQLVQARKEAVDVIYAH